MSFYPVIWRVSGGSLVAGRLELRASGLTLRGGRRGPEQRVEIGYDQIVGVGRTRERLGRLGAFRIDDLAGSVLIAGYGVVGLNTEILGKLNAVLAPAL